MKTYQVVYQGEKSDLIQLCKRVLISKSGKIKTVDPERGIIVCTLRYGLNPNGLRVSIHLNQTDNNTWQINVSAEFTNAADLYGTADKKALEISQLIEQRIENSDSSTDPNYPSDLAMALSQVKKTSIVSWTIIVLIGLAISAIPTGFGIVLVPLIGLVGAIIGLPLSRWLAKRAHNVVVIERDNNAHSNYFWLYDMVETLAQKAGIPMPEVGVYDSLDMNAFASGPTPKHSVVAFSTAILEKLDTLEIEAVAAHEIGHIISNDMRGMAILTGLISSFVLVFTLPLQGLRLLNGLSGSFSVLIEVILWVSKLILSILLTFLGSLIVKVFSRKREYKADAIASLLVGKEPMISALSKLSYETENIPVNQRSFNSFKISNNSNWAEIFSTHPSIEKRIQALESGTHTPF